MRPTVIFDFDGTLALGEGPIDAYADAVAEASGIEGASEAIAEARARFAAGDPSFIDGYDAVRQAAEAIGAGPEALSTGYRESRAHLATERAPIHAPEGLMEFLDRLAPLADLVLVTNSPDVRISEALDVLGASRIERRVCSARKPAGLVAVIEAALLDGPVLSVGDIYVNDLEPAAAVGAATALVGPTWRDRADEVTMAAETLPELYVRIEEWASTASS